MIDSPVTLSVNLAHLQAGDASEQAIARLADTLENIALDTSNLRNSVRSLEGAFSALSVGLGFSQPSLEDLTYRERRVAELVAEGESLRSISRRFNVTPATISKVFQIALAKLGLKSRQELVDFYKSRGGGVEPSDP